MKGIKDSYFCAGKSRKKRIVLTSFFIVSIMLTIPVCMPVINGTNVEIIEKNQQLIIENSEYQITDFESMSLEELISFVEDKLDENSNIYIKQFLWKINTLTTIMEKLNINEKEKMKNALTDIFLNIARLIALIIGIPIPDTDLENEPNCKSDWFKYYWVRYDYVRKQIEATADCENYEEFWIATHDWMNYKWIYSPIGVLLILGSVFGFADIATIGQYPGLGLAGWALLWIGFLLWVRASMNIHITRNMFDSLWSKEIDIIIRLLDEEGNPINITKNPYDDKGVIIPGVDQNKLPHAINDDIYNTNRYRSMRDDLKPAMEEVWTYELRWLFDIDYPNEPDQPPYHWHYLFPQPDSESNYDGWYSISSRFPNPSWSLSQYPAPPGNWTITIPDLIIYGKEYIGTKIKTSELDGQILPSTFYYNDSVTLEIDRSKDPWIYDISPPNEQKYIPLNPQLSFKIDDFETEDDETLLVYVYTNATDPTHEIDGTNLELLDAYGLPNNYIPESEIIIPTNKSVNINGEDVLLFNEYNTTYYWQIYVKDGDDPIRHFDDPINWFKTVKLVQ